MLGYGFGTYELSSLPPAVSDLPWVRVTPSQFRTDQSLQGYLHSTVRLFLLLFYKPNFGTESATQVKWNYHNSHLLASAHNKEVLIWDERVRSFLVKAMSPYIHHRKDRFPSILSPPTIPRSTGSAGPVSRGMKSRHVH
jgi:hypothetical protein